MGTVYAMGDAIIVDRLYKYVKTNSLVGFRNDIEVINILGVDWNANTITWKDIELVVINETVDVLWSGVVLLGDSEKNPIIPNKKLSDCKNGWLLVWSEYSLDTGVSNREFITSTVSKHLVKMHDGSTHSFEMLSNLTASVSTMTGKKVKIFNDRILGSQENSSVENSSCEVALRYIMEW